MSTPAPATSDRLLALAEEARGRAYAPYSGYLVGAALEAADGRVFVGCNVENASYSVTCCAERSALFAAVSAGARSFRRIVVTAAGRGPYPCGACRQALAEFAPDLEVAVVTDAGDRREFTLDQLLPHPFRFEEDGST
ncbi:MAG TPA: cytidine deaminase [Gemmatimonadota bacterium]|nr:cytidine deaminase [Gemmatimonadota bacterium]